MSDHESIDDAAALAGQSAESWSTPQLSYKEAVAKIGIIPTLVLRPITMDIHAPTIIRSGIFTGIPAFLSADFGYMGIVEEATVYALIGEEP